MTIRVVNQGGGAPMQGQLGRWVLGGAAPWSDLAAWTEAFCEVLRRERALVAPCEALAARDPGRT